MGSTTNTIDCEVVMLPQSDDYICKGDLVVDGRKQLIIASYQHGKIHGWMPQHLYFTSNEEITQKDTPVIVDNCVGKILSITGTMCEVDLGWSSSQTKPLADCRKIIASTAAEVQLLSIPFDFLKKYAYNQGVIKTVKLRTHANGIVLGVPVSEGQPQVVIVEEQKEVGMYMGCKVVMLPTEKSHIAIHKGKLQCDYATGVYLRAFEFEPQHIYFTSDEEINDAKGLGEGVYYIYKNTSTNTQELHCYYKGDMRPMWNIVRIVVATTDPFLKLPSIPLEWIKDVYIPSNASITDVKIEMERKEEMLMREMDEGIFMRTDTQEQILKLTDNNEVCILADEPIRITGGELVSKDGFFSSTPLKIGNQEPNSTNPPDVTRVEVIDHSNENMAKGKGARAYVKYDAKSVELSYQDDGKTLKIFIK